MRAATVVAQVLWVALVLAACGDDPHRIDSGSGDAAAEAGTDGGLDGAPRDSRVPVDTAPPDADATCAARMVEAMVRRLPVDIIFLVDNSASMQPAIDAVTAGLNDFADVIDASGIDFRVIMLSLRSPTNPVMIGGGTRYAVCIPEPLAGDAMCGNGPRFFQSSIDVRSTQPLEQFLGTLGQTAGYREGESRGGEPWRDFLRPEATKTIVVVTDDNSRLSADDFEHFPGGSNPFNSNTLPPGILDASWGGLFDGYLFHGLYGWGSESDPTTPCRYPGGTLPPSSGPTYTELVSRTGGVRAHICDGASAWGPFFDAVATAVTDTARIDCEIPLPDPPEGMALDPTKVNVVIQGTGGDTELRKVPDLGSCGPMGGWTYDDETMPTRVILCPSSCDLARERVSDGGTVLVQFGCETLLI